MIYNYNKYLRAGVPFLRFNYDFILIFRYERSLSPPSSSSGYGTGSSSKSYTETPGIVIERDLFCIPNFTLFLCSIK